MIYITYFAKLRNLPSHIIPVSICAKAPEWYTGIQYKKLAPTYEILMKYKKDHDKDSYIEHFQKEVLDKLNSSQVVLDLLGLVGNFKGLNYYPDIALVCYEKPTDFCHRHLVADWLNVNGFEVKEFSR
jgi:uncharacterized protein YeaO (DUF488 family)